MSHFAQAGRFAAEDLVLEVPLTTFEMFSCPAVVLIQGSPAPPLIKSLNQDQSPVISLSHPYVYELALLDEPL